MRVKSLHLITRLVTDRRPIASPLAQPVAWLEEYFHASHPLRADYLKPWIALYYAMPRKLSSMAELVALQWLHYSVLGFSPFPAWSPVWLPGGWGFPCCLALKD